MTHWQYLDEPHFVITRELRIHQMYQQRKQGGPPPPQGPATPSIS